MPEWTDIWPHDPGIYLFYGYPINIEVDRYPRMMMVTVEGYSAEFGTVYRTARSTIKPGTGAAGVWAPVAVYNELPAVVDLMTLGEEAFDKHVRKHHGPKKISKRHGRRLK